MTNLLPWANDFLRRVPVPIRDWEADQAKRLRHGRGLAKRKQYLWLFFWASTGFAASLGGFHSPRGPKKAGGTRPTSYDAKIAGQTRFR